MALLESLLGEGIRTGANALADNYLPGEQDLMRGVRSGEWDWLYGDRGIGDPLVEAILGDRSPRRRRGGDGILGPLLSLGLGLPLYFKGKGDEEDRMRPPAPQGPSPLRREIVDYIGGDPIEFSRDELMRGNLLGLSPQQLFPSPPRPSPLRQTGEDLISNVVSSPATYDALGGIVDIIGGKRASDPVDGGDGDLLAALSDLLFGGEGSGSGSLDPLGDVGLDPGAFELGGQETGIDPGNFSLRNRGGRSMDFSLTEGLGL